MTCVFGSQHFMKFNANSVFALASGLLLNKFHLCAQDSEGSSNPQGCYLSAHDFLTGLVFSSENVSS